MKMYDTAVTVDAHSRIIREEGNKIRKKILSLQPHSSTRMLHRRVSKSAFPSIRQ